MAAITSSQEPAVRGMHTVDDVRKLHLAGPTVLTIGNFDGIHRGHQSLLRHMVSLARGLVQAGHATARTALLTFDPHPLSVLRPDQPHFLLTTPTERLELAAACGIELGIVQPFNLEAAQLAPRDFMEWMVRHLGLAVLVVGPDFALGRNRSGDIDTLRALSTEMGFGIEVIAPVEGGHHPVRSSHVRELLRMGSVDAAATILGRSYRVAGPVILGDQRGRQVGIPTANVHVPANKLLPADGVYATRTTITTYDRVYRLPSATNVGVRPTVDGVHRRVETHILDFPPPGQVDNLYGRTIAVDFLFRLRGEKRFANIDELVKQIHADIAQARILLTSPLTRSSSELTGEE